VYMTSNMTSHTPRLDPVVIVGHDEIRKQVTVRRLLRKQHCVQSLDPARAYVTLKNELTWTNKLITVSASRIDRKCHIRFFSKKQVQSGNLPFPYHCEGRWDFWYITS
jgi:DNA (cytosine-5)-methyltransferase 1